MSDGIRNGDQIRVTRTITDGEETKKEVKVIRKWRFKIEVDEGEVIPFWYGVAWVRYDWGRRIYSSVVCFPIPLNWLFRWVRQLFIWMKVAPSKMDFESIKELERLGDERLQRIWELEQCLRCAEGNFRDRIPTEPGAYKEGPNYNHQVWLWYDTLFDPTRKRTW